MLVLNLNYVPVNVCSVRRAIVMVDKGKAELLEQHEGSLHTVSGEIEAPAIIRLVYLVKRPFLPRKLSKKEVFLRDRFTCQYCGKKAQDLTLDHVIPRRQNGAHTWENVVTACNRCNLHKAGHTPSEARMKLRTVPRAPRPQPLPDPPEPDDPRGLEALHSLEPGVTVRQDSVSPAGHSFCETDHSGNTGRVVISGNFLPFSRSVPSNGRIK